MWVNIRESFMRVWNSDSVGAIFFKAIILILIGMGIYHLGS